MVTLIVAAILSQDPREELLKSQTAAAIELLGKASANDYRRGQTAIAEIGRAAEAALVAALTNEAATAQVRALACDSLGDIRASSKPAVDALRGRLGDRAYFGTTVASRAARALGRIGDPSAIADLIAALKGATDDTALRYESIVALGRLRAIDAIGEIKTRVGDKAKTDTHQLVASAALQALAMLNARGAVEEVAAALDDGAPDEWGPMADMTVGQVAVWTLEQLMPSADWPGGPKSIAEMAAAQRQNRVNDWKAWRDNRKKVVEARAKLDALVAAIAAYKTDTGKLPEKLEALHSGEKKYVADVNATTDPWITSFAYDVPGWGADYNLYSKGADNKRGGTGLNADLWNHEAWQAFTVDKTKATLKELGNAVELYQKQKGSWPPSLLTLKNENLFAGAIEDAWGNVPAYEPGTETTSYKLTSYGYDGKPRGEGVDADLTHP